MKKAALFLILICMVAGIAAAETPKYFSFNIGGMYVYDMASETSTVAKPFGLQFQMNETFSAGFIFFQDAQLVNVTISPINNTYLSFYTGKFNPNATGAVGFGAGIGYDFASTKNTMFSAIGIYLDWLANNDSSGNKGSIEDGGCLMVGLKAKLGL